MHKYEPIPRIIKIQTFMILSIYTLIFTLIETANLITLSRNRIGNLQFIIMSFFWTWLLYTNVKNATDRILSRLIINDNSIEIIYWKSKAIELRNNLGFRLTVFSFFKITFYRIILHPNEFRKHSYWFSDMSFNKEQRSELKKNIDTLFKRNEHA